MNNLLQWWLGDLANSFEDNKNVLKEMNLEKENKLENEVANYFSTVPYIAGHGLEHHKRVKTFASVIGVTENLSQEDIQLCRYAAQIHDTSKVIKRGGTEHDWKKIKELSENLMRNAKIEDRYRPKIFSIVEEHDKDNPSERSELGNIVYGADTTDLTFLPRCFAFAETVETLDPGTYNTMDKVIKDYKRLHIERSKPTTVASKRMFEVGKSWALPTLDVLKDNLGNRNLRKYFQFLNLDWRKNIERAPTILIETLDTYSKIIPNYEISL
jgi:ribosomal protein S17E